MAWTAPMTAVANDIFTAAQFNTHVRDNLLETVPAKATSSVVDGSFFVKTGTNSINNGARTPMTAVVSGTETTTSTSYAALATAQQLDVVTGTMALVTVGSRMYISGGGNTGYMSVAISGASSVTVADDWALQYCSEVSNREFSGSRTYLFTGLTAGTNTFAARFKVTAGTGSFRYRSLSVIPF